MKRFSILIAALCLCLTGCGKQTTEATAQIFAMDTVMEVAAYGEHAEQAVKYTEKRMRRVVWRNTVSTSCTLESRKAFCRYFWDSSQIFWC